ncbi:MAG: hypothetical protein U0Z70_02815 [Thermomicrobiales bacterium]|nr:hypothetical protein [Chloroflexia bacterium]
MGTSPGQGPSLRHYTRPPEHSAPLPPAATIVPYEESETTIAGSSLTPGAKALLRGLLRVGTTREFPGGGAGIEYGSLLKTAARPDYLAQHIAEAADHLTAARTDLLLVPGMSGYPIGAMYALAARVPALLLKKSQLDRANPNAYPAGAFVIPSYTGDGDVVMHADPAAAEDIFATIVARKLQEQEERDEVSIELRVAGADDIIDKATMSHAISESALVIGEAAMSHAVARHRAFTGDTRPITTRVAVTAWVTPLIKGYNRPHEHLWNAFRVRPFAGLNLSAVYLDPPAIAIDGVGAFAFARTGDAAR